MNFSALRHDNLFPGSNAPATAFIAEGGEFAENRTFYLVNVERSEAFKRHGILEIGPENVKKVSLQHVLSDTDVLKIASWGNARDMALIIRLRSVFPSLSMLISDPKKVKVRNEEVLGGQGFQTVSSSKEAKEAPKLVGKYLLPSSEMQQYSINALELGRILPGSKFHRRRDPRIYEAPLVVTTLRLYE